METRASYILVGGFVLALVATTFAIIVWLSRVEFEAVPQRYSIFFTGSVTGLSIGSAVRYRGVPVGSVTEIAIDSANIERIRVQIEVAEGTPIKTDMIASLGVQGITGVAFIHLSGGTQTAPLLAAKDGAALPVIPSQTSGLEKLFTSAPELLDRGVTLLAKISVLFDEKNVKAISETLENVRLLSESVAGQRGKIESVLTDAEATLGALRRSSESVRALSATLNKKADPMADATLKVMKNAQTTLAEIRKATRSLRGVSDGLGRIVSETRAPLQDFSSNGLYEFAQFLAEARVLVAGLSRLSAQIERDPAKFFFGDTQKGFEAK